MATARREFGYVRNVSVDVTCPTCGQDPLKLIAMGTTRVTSAPIIVRCEPCQQSFLLEATLSRISGARGPGTCSPP